MRRKRLIKSSKQISLMHGTSSVFINSILEEGLKPMGFTGNGMFTYNDYGRTGEPKHPECIYLTNDFENAQRYANNAVKRNQGFPLIVEVEISTTNLTWDDDSFYRNYNDFDLGEKDGYGNWIKKPKKELWEQSIDINTQCAHHGVINPEEIKFYSINNKWWDEREFKLILEDYSHIQLDKQLLSEDEVLNKKSLVILNEWIEFKVDMINRNIYMYDLKIDLELDIYLKQALSLKVFELLKGELSEFGATVIQSPGFKEADLIGKNSSFNYVFGSFKILSNDKIKEDISECESGYMSEKIIIDKIIKLEATQEEFKHLYEYAVDFVGDIVKYCEQKLNLNNIDIVHALEKIKNHYNDIYRIIDAEIEYLKIKSQRGK